MVRPDRVRPEQRQQRPVTPGPDLVRQGPALGQSAPDPAKCGSGQGALCCQAHLLSAGGAAALSSRRSRLPSVIDGSVEPGFEEVREEFEANFARRRELGAACAAYHRGVKVVDLWGGRRSADGPEPWREDTLVLVYSTSKGLAAMAIALAHSRGWLDYDATVASYWPEFAAGRQGERDGAPAPDPPGRPVRHRRTARRGQARRPGRRGRRDRAPAARVGAGHAARLSRVQHRLVRGRADPPRRSAAAQPRPLLRRGDRRAARPRVLLRAARRTCRPSGSPRSRGSRVPPRSCTCEPLRRG